MAESLPEICCPSHGAWKPAPNAGFHIPTATTTTVTRFGRKANPARIAGPVRFLHRTLFYTSCLAGVVELSHGLKHRLEGRATGQMDTHAKGGLPNPSSDFEQLGAEGFNLSGT